jgi:hypothetical protein
MLRNSQYLEGCAIAASDGVIGEVKDLYRQRIRPHGSAMAGREVLFGRNGKKGEL